MIAIEEVSKAFGGVAALDGCGFHIQKGTVTGLIGPNGAGKSTLFDIIAGALRPDAGRIRFDGRDITGLAAHRRVHLGLLRTFQVPRGFPRMTVTESLMLVPPRQSGENLLSAWFRPRRMRREEALNRDKAAEVLDFLRLTHLADAPAGALSGGQKKLLELGRTMMTEARMVLLDEPGAGVNRTLLKEISEAIGRLNRERGYTFCIIEHDMDLVAEMCDPVVVLTQGRVLSQGAMDEIRRDAAVLEAYFGGAPQAPGNG